MATREERIAYLEGKVDEQSHAFPAIQQAIGRFEQRIDRLEQRIDVRFGAVDRRVDALDEKVSRQFVWTVGIQLTTLIAIVGALLSRS